MTKILVLVAVILNCQSKCTGDFTSDDSGNMSCPTWMYRSDKGQCVCGNSPKNVIFCNNISQEVIIMDSFCLTSCSQDNKQAMVGRCLYAQNRGKIAIGRYIKVDRNIFKQDQQLCRELNREGLLCGQCTKYHFVSPYSYDLKCYKCNSSLVTNIILYVTVAYVPLTLFLAIIVIFHISFSTPRLNLVIYLCQNYSIPAIM